MTASLISLNVDEFCAKVKVDKGSLAYAMIYICRLYFTNYIHCRGQIIDKIEYEDLCKLDEASYQTRAEKRKH